MDPQLIFETVSKDIKIDKLTKKVYGLFLILIALITYHLYISSSKDVELVVILLLMISVIVLILHFTSLMFKRSGHDYKAIIV